jgi:hypothetical protein
VGYGGHWLQSEAESLGMGWRAATMVADSLDGESWLGGIEQAMTAIAEPVWLPAADLALGRPFAAWVLQQLQLARG